MGTKQLPTEYDGYARALPDEPMFTLLARDTSAPDMVLRWAYERAREIAQGRRPKTDLALVAEARRCADTMTLWRRENFGAWRTEQPTEPVPDTATSAP